MIEIFDIKKAGILDYLKYRFTLSLEILHNDIHNIVIVFITMAPCQVDCKNNCCCIMFWVVTKRFLRFVGSTHQMEEKWNEPVSPSARTGSEPQIPLTTRTLISMTTEVAIQSGSRQFPTTAARQPVSSSARQLAQEVGWCHKQ